MPDVLMGSSIEVHVNFGQLPSGEGSRLFRGNAAAAATMPIRFLTVWYGMNSEVVHASGSRVLRGLDAQKGKCNVPSRSCHRGCGKEQKEKGDAGTPVCKTSARRVEDGSTTTKLSAVPFADPATIGPRSARIRRTSSRSPACCIFPFKRGKVRGNCGVTVCLQSGASIHLPCLLISQ